MTLPGEYRLIARLGRGASGDVWRAHSLRLDRSVAIKRLTDGAGSGAVDEALLSEAEAVARLRNPAIVHVYEVNVDDAGRLFLVMELLDGRDLRWASKRFGAVGAKRAVAMLLPVVRGLAYAHDCGIVHGNVKPANIVLAVEAEGVVQSKLIDFAVGRRASPPRSATDDAASAAAFIAPERLDPDAAATPAGDQWAAGATLYVLLTTRPPFAGPTPLETMRASATAPLPFPREVDLDGRLFAILAQMMRKHPGDRYASMHAAGDALSAWLSTHRRGIRS